MPPRAADPDAVVRGVNRPLVNSAVIHVEVLRVNGAEIPAAALEHALDRFRDSVRADVRVIDRATINVPVARDGGVPDFDWPLWEAGERVARNDIEAAAGWYRVASKTGGLQGAVAQEQAGGTKLIRPIIGPDTILLVALPHETGGRNVTGYCASATLRNENGAFEVGFHKVVCQADVIRSRSRIPGVSRRKLWEWTILHELGHVVGVPADASHARMSNGAHCTVPTCVMYSPADLRLVWAGILNGWPLDYCGRCKAEIMAAKDAARRSAERSP